MGKHPAKCNRNDPICFSPYLYRARNQIERFFNRIKQCGRVATRYDRLAANYLALVQLASIRDDVAHLSNLISPSGETFWLVSFMASVKLRAFCCGHVGNAIALSKRSGMFTAPRAQVFRADDGVRRRLLSLDEAIWDWWRPRQLLTLSGTCLVH